MTPTNINGSICVEIEPIKVKYNDPTECTYLSTTILHDNMLDSATIGWQLLMYIGPDWQASDSGRFTVNVQNYTNWDGSSEYIFNHIAPVLGLKIKQ